MVRPHVQFKIPHDLHIQVRAYGDRHGLKGDTAVMLHMLTAFFSVGNHAEFAKSERIPTTKKKATWKPLSEHTRARMQVLHTFEAEVFYGATTSDIAYLMSGEQTTNNVSKRIQELASEGYLEASGEYRKSRDSGKRLTVWRRTDKPLPE